ncbi:phosphoribosylamine--glycine ligase [uncultured Anaerococcus sp.]|uniref:phosphoribosylamine--glycine ligase n=1 Tax=uncultured Anaerococcus sp. TaxID=293428 RepID=UPI00260A5BDB|nr:phosphoribosylamine--glycine ligase [uncultured Anaerococcus sp.]
MARVLVLGNGGREAAISYKLYKEGHEIFMVGENPGVAEFGKCVDLKNEEIAGFAKSENIDLVFVGPEAYLVDGIVDILEKENIRVFGPNKKAAILEGSKSFAKDLMKKYGIPTAAYEIFTSYEKALAYLDKSTFPLVIKADGLAAGKGVIIAENYDMAKDALKEIMVNQKFAEAGNEVVIEEFLEGEEFSLLAFISGEKVVPMKIVQDHKRAFDGDKGPNTGGMGVYMPIKHINQADIDEAMEKILRPTAKAMIKEKREFKGILFAGLMKTKDGIKTIEYNVRFGDPETEILLLAMKSNLYDIAEKVIDGKDFEVEFDDAAYIGVVMASKGYPESYAKGFEIKGLEKVDSHVFHMGTKAEDGKILTNGGRVLIVCSKADNLSQAYKKAYEDIEKIECDNLFFRKDIGHMSLEEV